MGTTMDVFGLSDPFSNDDLRNANPNLRHIQWAPAWSMEWQTMDDGSAGELSWAEEGQVFIANGWERPEGFCPSAWDTLSPFVLALSHGAEDFYEGWMKNPRSAMLSCNDGFRPVSFLVEALNEDAD